MKKFYMKKYAMTLACRRRPSSRIVKVDIGLIAIGIVHAMTQDEEIMHIGV